MVQEVSLFSQNGYFEHEVIEGLQGVSGSRKLSFRYELFDVNGDLVDDLDNVLECEVENNTLADIKRTARFTILDDGQINYISDRIKPWVRLALPKDDTPVTNLVRNSGFEVSLLGWTSSVSATTLTRVNTQSHSGSWSAEIKKANTSNTIFTAVTNDDGTGFARHATTGGTVTVSAWVRIPAAAYAGVTALGVVGHQSPFVQAFAFEFVNKPSQADTWEYIEVSAPLLTDMSMQDVQIQFWTDGSHSTNAVIGYIDDVVVVREGFTKGYDDVIASIDNPLLRWRFNETSGATAYDYSGNSRHGTIGAGVIQGKTPLLAEGSSFEFNPDLTTSQVTYPSATFMNGLDKIGVVAWVQADSIGTNRGVLFAKAPDGTSTAMKIAYDTSGDVGSAANCISAWVYTSAGLVQAYTRANVQNIDTMCLVVTWQSGVGIRIYINGELATLSGESNQALVGTTAGASTLTLGRSNDSAITGVWDGKIDDFSIFNTFLTETQAAELYLTGLQTGKFGPKNYAEWAQGVFMLTSPIRTADVAGVVTRDVQAYDQLLILQDDKVGSRTAFAAGTNYVTNVTVILTGAGITDFHCTTSSKTLPIAMEWEPGTSKLRIVNDLLAAINYESLFFSEHGVAVARPYQSPAERPADYTYSDDEVSVIFPDANHTLDLFGVANKWVMVVSDPDRPTLTATYTNSNPASVTSTVNRGRTILDFRTEEDAADQTTLNAKVLRLAFEASQIFEEIAFNTVLMPFHSNSNVIGVVHSDLAISDKYAERTWSMHLSAGGTMQHVVRRVVSV